MFFSYYTSVFIYTDHFISDTRGGTLVVFYKGYMLCPILFPYRQGLLGFHPV